MKTVFRKALIVSAALLMIASSALAAPKSDIVDTAVAAGSLENSSRYCKLRTWSIR